MSRVFSFLSFQRQTCLLAAALLCAGLAVQAETTEEEAKLIGVLQSDADWLAKQDACRRLRQIGTAASVPALAGLLGDEHLAQMARYALENMPYPEVNAVLRAALATAPNGPKAGVATSLGVRRDAEAVSALIPLLNADDRTVADAVAGALGRIGTAEAAKALLAADRPDLARTLVLDEAALAAGERLIEDGEEEAAQRTFGALYDGAGQPRHIRMGAFRGLAYAAPSERPALLVGALAGGDPIFRDLAAQLVAETAGDGYSAFYTDKLESLPAGGQVALLRALATRGEAAGRPTVLNAVNSENTDVRIAALKALSALGTAEDVALLAPIAIGEGDIAQAAHATLVALEADGVEAAMSAITQSADGPMKIMMLNLLVVRAADEAVPAALARLEDTDADVRLAALSALSALGAVEQAPVLLSIMAQPSGDEQSTAAKALNAICAREREAMLPAVLGALEKASPAMQVDLMAALQRVGGPDAIAAVVARMAAPEEAVRKAAMDTLLGWPTAEAAPHLLPFMEHADSEWHDAALRAYVRIAKSLSAVGDRVAMLEKATGLCATRDDKWVVLAAWGTVPTPATLKVLRSYLDDGEVRNEAAAAILGASRDLAKRGDEAKALVREAVGEILEKCENEAVRRRAERALEQLG